MPRSAFWISGMGLFLSVERDCGPPLIIPALRMDMGAGLHINVALQEGFGARCGASSHAGGCGCLFIHDRAAVLLPGLESAS